jgi:spore coat protein YsxE
MDNLQKVLNEYELHAEAVEEKKGLYKVTAAEGIFALKKISSIKRDQNIFQNNYMYLSNKGYKHIIPIYRTKQGHVAVTINKDFYYLMPWIKNEKVSNKQYYQAFIKDLSEMHAKTLDETFNETDVETVYQRFQNHLKKRKEVLEIYAQTVERRVYMSPFDYEFMNYFPYLMQSIDRSLYFQHQWFEKAKEKSHYRRSVCHGKLSSNHYCFADNNRFFISVNHLTFDQPVKDLARALHSMLKVNAFNEADIEELLIIYEKNMPLLEDEKQLLKGYLTYPKHVFQVVDSYYQNKRKGSEYFVSKSFTRSIEIFHKHEILINKINESEHI